MNRGPRAAALGGLALLLGGLAASDVAEREAELKRRMGPGVPVVVARVVIERGDAITARKLALRRVPARYAPRVAFSDRAEVAGARAGTTIQPGTDLNPALLAGAGAGADGALTAAGPGERIARIVAVGSAEELPPGARADLLVTRERSEGGASTRIALRDAEVVEASAAPAPPEGETAGLPRVALALRVTLRQAVYLAQAQAEARELRALPRPPSASRGG